jgi:hypothetical protein
MRKTQADLIAALRDMHSRGRVRVRGGTVAEALWPDARTQNAQGQVFNLTAGVAGRMLKACKAVREVSPGEYEILAHRLA